MNDIVEFYYPKNKKKRIEIELNTFVLTTSNTINYIYSNPDELIIVNSSFNYHQPFLQSIIDGGIKLNVKKIITSDSVVVKYLANIEKMFSSLFPNCKTIQINSFENEFVLISRIIDDLVIVENIEYKLNDYILLYNSILKYKYFYVSFFTYSLANIKYVKITNDIDENKTNCVIEKNQITNIIIPNTIDKKNKLQIESINKHNTDKSSINNLYFEYIDNKRNVFFSKNIINIVNIDFIEDNFFFDI
jgi:hypothetical protein